MKKHAAGFLIGKLVSGNKIKFLGLVADEATRKARSGIYDIPKGKFNKDESDIDCAIRECFEESGILFSKDDVIGKPSIKNGLVIYSALTEDNPEINPNPESGIVEHEGFKWLDEKTILDLCLGYLRDSIFESIDNIKIELSLK